MPFGSLIERYRQFKKNRLLTAADGRFQYAFLGVGSHSLQNLYPCLHFLGVPLKYIYSKKFDNAQKAAARFAGARAANDLDLILKDPEVTGVFICLRPELHFETALKVLAAGKHVFVEKPPCNNLQQLERLHTASTGKICLTGLQRRYSPFTRAVTPFLKKAVSYNYRFVTGAYPEGDVLRDLFIHPLDYMVHLFGAVKHCHATSTGNRETLLLLTEHTNGTKGVAELSAAHSWHTMSEQISITTTGEIIDATFPFTVFVQEKGKKILGVPLEKISGSAITRKTVYNRLSAAPAAENNMLVTSGFLGEIETFVRLCEGKKAVNKSSPEHLLPTYSLLASIRV